MNAKAPSPLVDALVTEEPAAATPSAPATEAPRLPLALRLLHVFILVNLTLQYLYAGYQVFFVLQPEGTWGPMFGRAMSLSPELLMARRLYAIEAWLAFIGFAIYVGITEILPRRRHLLEALLARS